MRLAVRGLLILIGAIVAGVVVAVLGYVGFWLFDTCPTGGRRVCEPWPAMGFGLFLGIIATPVGGALTYWRTRPAASRVGVRDA